MEALWPRRPRPLGRRQRWPANLSLMLLNTLLARWTLAAAPYLLAHSLTQNQQGLLPYVGIEGWAATLLTWFVLEGVVYWQHRLFHTVPLFWRLHKVHHSDKDLDVTSGVRFHPIEILASLLVKLSFVGLLGADPLGYLIFEISLSLGSLFNHSNIHIPEKWDKFIRLFFVTPDMHRIHHSVIPSQHNTNYSFSLSIFDRLFGSYLAIAFEAQGRLTLGINEVSNNKRLTLWGLLKMPFINK